MAQAERAQQEVEVQEGVGRLPLLGEDDGAGILPVQVWVQDLVNEERG